MCNCKTCTASTPLPGPESKAQSFEYDDSLNDSNFDNSDTNESSLSGSKSQKSDIEEESLSGSSYDKDAQFNFDSHDESSGDSGEKPKFNIDEEALDFSDAQYEKFLSCQECSPEPKVDQSFRCCKSSCLLKNVGKTLEEVNDIIHR